MVNMKLEKKGHKGCFLGIVPFAATVTADKKYPGSSPACLYEHKQLCLKYKL